jgi:hypothetical protein
VLQLCSFCPKPLLSYIGMHLCACRQDVPGGLRLSHKRLVEFVGTAVAGTQAVGGLGANTALSSQIQASCTYGSCNWDIFCVGFRLVHRVCGQLSGGPVCGPLSTGGASPTQPPCS